MATVPFIFNLMSSAWATKVLAELKGSFFFLTFVLHGDDKKAKHIYAFELNFLVKLAFLFPPSEALNL